MFVSDKYNCRLRTAQATIAALARSAPGPLVTWKQHANIHSGQARLQKLFPAVLTMQRLIIDQKLSRVLQCSLPAMMYFAEK